MFAIFQIHSFAIGCREARYSFKRDERIPFGDFLDFFSCSYAILSVSLREERCSLLVWDSQRVAFVLSIEPRPVRSQSGLISSYVSRIFSILEELSPFPPVHSKSKCNKQPRFSWSLIYEKHRKFAPRPGRVVPKSDTGNTKKDPFCGLPKINYLCIVMYKQLTSEQRSQIFALLQRVPPTCSS